MLYAYKLDRGQANGHNDFNKLYRKQRTTYNTAFVMTCDFYLKCF